MELLLLFLFYVKELRSKKQNLSVQIMVTRKSTSQHEDMEKFESKLAQHRSNKVITCRKYIIIKKSQHKY